VVDPVMISKHGDPLMAPEAAAVLRDRLLPRALLVTPNMPEAAVLAEMEVTALASLERAAARIAARGPRHVLVKGGRLAEASVDVLYSEGELHRYASPRIDSLHTHGSGCVYSAAITARLARGEAVARAIHGAKMFITAAIRTSPGLGGGRGPVNMLAPADAS
jgi:hydroxymethylpyrimidine/phosphomethylpyrimidine kinase